MNASCRGLSLRPILLALPLALTGCGASTIPKIEDPVEIEKLRVEYQEMSHKEMGKQP